MTVIEIIARTMADEDGYAFDGPVDPHYSPIAKAVTAALAQAGYIVTKFDPKADARALHKYWTDKLELENGPSLAETMANFALSEGAVAVERMNKKALDGIVTKDVNHG